MISSQLKPSALLKNRHRHREGKMTRNHLATASRAPSKHKKKKKRMRQSKKKVNMGQQKLAKYIEFLSVIKGLKEKDFKTMMPYLNNEACNLLSECIHNSLCNMAISPSRRKKLREALWEKKKVLRYIAKSSNKVDRKRKLLPQLGGNLGLIISAVLPILMRLFSGQQQQQQHR